VVPKIVESYCGAPDLIRARQRVTAGLRGDVVEIGFGSGLNLPYLPDGVRHLYAIDPEAAGQRLGAERIAASSVPISFVGLDGQHLPLEDASMDSALCAFTLCTIPDAHLALTELRRVLRPGGTFHFIEHGLAPETTVARWQHRLTPIQKRVCGGCHFDRKIDELITGAGFTITELSTAYRKGPKVPGYTYEGVAVSP
jgi:ubiquinone/menaquinone biosynthesis C-methylase UbiE